MQTLDQLKSGHLRGIKKLQLKADLTEFPREILELAPTLEYLDLSGNRLKALPDDFARLQNLKIAFFSENDFTEFPAVLGTCPNLEMIGFKSCKIATIPEKAFPIKLRWLILTNNQLTYLPKSIGKCTRLQKLMLAGNKLKNLPPEMAACHYLGLLRIAANRLTELPEWLFSLPQLAWLACAGNPFSYSAPVSHNLPEISWSDLVIAEQLGQGASGVIYKGEWKIKETAPKTLAVAIKLFKGEVTSDGLPADEMRACMAAGAHPHLVPVLGKIAEHPAQKQGLVLELIPPDFKILGNTPSLETCTRDYYDAGTTFTLQQLLTIASGTAAAVAQLHDRGIMHGDLYAHNILINEAAKPLFGDFGAASFYDKTDKERATRLERLEVRAFGYLLEDLLNHLDSRDSNHPSVAIINNLKKTCLHPDILQRSDFVAICVVLERAATFVVN